MQKRGLRRLAKLLAMATCFAGIGTSAVWAVSSSPNYQVTETEFGATSANETCSGQYCARASIGDVTGGSDSKSSGSSATFGSITSDEPLLEVIVDPGESNLGTLTTEQTATKTMVVRIRNYLSNGYVLQITGNAPKYGNHTLATPSTPTASDPGTEQFALNAADNSTPNVGASPVQVPSNEFSFGEVEDDYKTANLFQYISGDVVARSTQASGQTDYTISMIVNISNATPAGHYSGDFSAVVIPFY